MMRQQSAVPQNASDPSYDNTKGDSSILRYIKKLTTHQTKAKQQRMDRYLQHVKRALPAEDFPCTVSKPVRLVPATGQQRSQQSDGASALPRFEKAQQQNSGCSRKQAAAFPRPIHSQSQPKRLRKRNSEGNRQQNRRKRARGKRQTTTSGPLDRFRWNDTASSQNQVSSTCGTKESSSDKMAPLAAAPRETRHIQSMQLQRSTLEPLRTNSRVRTARADSTWLPVQPQEPPSVVDPYSVPDPTHDPSISAAHSTSFLAQDKTPQDGIRGASSQHGMFVPTHDPLSRIMESIYF
ncbi:unnamed protein product [Hyaloperonospora brassicae]|uniref:Uncharacterized protein n=1 Tax=Hyaloperonospora brassicae TaxID=162125 RepID=A0AAV0SY98_HYABA|nr:unnamed protein product [Hyaloperonospora brassicae]